MGRDVNVNMKLTETEKSVEKLILSKITPEDAILKFAEIQGESRYFPLRSYWSEALMLGAFALKRSEAREQIAEEVCDNICRWREQAFSEHKDPDDAKEWLLNNHCNADCPIVRLMQ